MPKPLNMRLQVPFWNWSRAQEGILYYIMGEAYIGLGDYASAAKLLRASIHISPDGPYSADAYNYLSELNESGEELEDEPEGYGRGLF